MYLGKRKINNPDEYERLRQMNIDIKSGAVFTAFAELEDLINKSQLAQQYFDKSQSWLSQRIHGCMVLKKSMAFKEEEYHQLAEAFRHIAMRLNAHADEIDNAALELPERMR